MQQYVPNCEGMDEKGRLLNERARDFDLVMIPSTGTISATMNRQEVAYTKYSTSICNLRPNDPTLTQPKLFETEYVQDQVMRKYVKLGRAEITWMAR